MSMPVAWTPGPKEPMDVYLAAPCDSMGSGRGDVAQATPGYPSPLLYMCKSASAGVVPLVEPCGDGALASAGMGPWGLFCDLVAAQTGRMTCIVNAGVGGSTTAQWVPGQPNYNAALGKLQRVMSRRNTTLRGILVYIGPNDAASGATPNWLANVQAALAGFRGWANATPAQVPAIVSQLPVVVPTDNQPTGYPGNAHVKAQIAAIADANHLLINVPPNDVPATREAYLLHHAGAENRLLAQQALDLAVAHPSWQ